MDYSGLSKSLQMNATINAISKAYGTNGLDEHKHQRRRPAIKQDNVASPPFISGRHGKKLQKQPDQAFGERSPGKKSNLFHSMNSKEWKESQK